MDRKTMTTRLGTKQHGMREYPVVLVLFIVSLLFLPIPANSQTEKQENGTPRHETASGTASFSLPQTTREGTKPQLPPINRPVQITFRTDPLLYAASSENGKWLVYVSENKGVPELWLRSADLSGGGPPEKLAPGEGKVWEPVLSKDGGLIAFVGDSHDAKGDIFLINRNSPDLGPQRLTGRETADGAPVFSPDGKTLYFHQSRPGENRRQIMALDPANPTAPPRTLDTKGDAAFPSLSPDGKICAFVSVRDDPGGDIFLIHLDTGKVTGLTRGPERDLSPKWSRDGKYIYFTRLSPDRQTGSIVAEPPNPGIFRIRADEENATAYPVTSGSFPAFSPMPTADALYFLSTQKGTGNIWKLPLEGEIPLLKTGKDQLALAEALASRIPPDVPAAISAYYKVLEADSSDTAVAAKAAYEMGRLYEQTGEPEKAIQAYDLAAENSSGKTVEPVLARIRSEGLKAGIQWRQAPSEQERRKVMENALTRLKTMALGSKEERAQDTSPASSGSVPNHDQARISARSRIEQARILMDLAGSPTSLVQAMGLLDDVIKTDGTPRPQLAEALYLKAECFSRIGRGEALLPAYIKVVEQFPDVEEWSDKAVIGILNLRLSRQDLNNEQARIRLLSDIAREYREKLPKLTIGAWNRIGDLYFASGEWASAKAAYRQVIDQFPENTAQTAAARLALAEILYREELFSQALDLYENEMASRSYHDRLYELAWQGYVRKSLAAADFLYHLGEVPAAQKIYADLIRRDDSLLQAHRGFIKCAAARKQIQKVREEYGARLVKDPNDATALYCLGLCLTYEPGVKSLEEAQKLIQKAIGINGQIAYFHQTSGYISEVLETVYGKPGGLEAAMESYRKAYFLNDQESDPVNGANLSLNLGNISYLLGQFSDAFENYSRRLDSGAPFDNEDTEILFYRRLGESAFQIGEPGRPVQAYEKALALIEKSIDPRRASEIAGKINSHIFDRILTPALKDPKLAERAKGLATAQTEINRRLFDAAEGMTAIPPDPKWGIYKGKMEAILADQEKIIRELTPLIPENPSETTDDLLFMVERATETLRFPEDLVRMKAEMLDRLGLALQEEKMWRQAREAFEKAYALNKGLGLTQNLAVNRRSAAYCAYMEAGTLPGEARKEMLKKAYDGFQEVIALAKKYGVPNKKAEARSRNKTREKEGLINLNLDISLDNVDSTRAAYGFSREQEERLAMAFMARIKTELGQLAPAESAIREQLSQYPENAPISDSDLFGVSLLQHRAGQLAYASREPAAAFDRFRRSAQLCLRMKSPVSAALNVVNMAQSLASIPRDSPEWMKFYSEWTLLDKETTGLLDRFSAVLDPLVIPSYHNELGVYHLAFLPKQNASSLMTAVRRELAMERAVVHFSRAIKQMETGPASRNRNALALLSALNLNMAEMSLYLRLEPDDSRKYLTKALDTAREGLLPRYEWRALAGLGKLKEALAVLSRVPNNGGGLRPR